MGIAIGAGTDIAIESSDVVLIGERLTAVVDAYHIGRQSYRKTVQNLALVQRRADEYLDYYHNRRPHLALNMLTPSQFAVESHLR